MGIRKEIIKNEFIGLRCDGTDKKLLFDFCNAHKISNSEALLRGLYIIIQNDDRIPAEQRYLAKLKEIEQNTNIHDEISRILQKEAYSGQRLEKKLERMKKEGVHPAYSKEVIFNELVKIWFHAKNPERIIRDLYRISKKHYPNLLKEIKSDFTKYKKEHQLKQKEKEQRLLESELPRPK